MRSRSDQITPEGFVKLLYTDRHFHTVKWILHDEVAIDLVTPSDHKIRIGLFGTRKEQKLDTGRALVASQSEMTALQTLNSGCEWSSVSWYGWRGRRGVDAARDGMNAMKGAG